MTVAVAAAWQFLVNTFHLISILCIVVVVFVAVACCCCCCCCIAVIVVVHFTTIAKSTLISCTAKDARNVFIPVTYWVIGYDNSVEKRSRRRFRVTSSHRVYMFLIGIHSWDDINIIILYYYYSYYMYIYIIYVRINSYISKTIRAGATKSTDNLSYCCTQ